MTKTIDVAKPDTPLSELVSLALSGIEVVLTQGDKPLVRLVPIEPVAPARVAGLNPGAMVARDDFDAPLPDTFWTGTE